MSFSRRRFLTGLSVSPLALSLASCGGSGSSTDTPATPVSPGTPDTTTPPSTTVPASLTPPLLMPAEGSAHAATWMAYGATASAWGTSGKVGQSRSIARKDLMRIAVNLSRFETVNMLVNASDLSEAQSFLAAETASSQLVASSGNLPAIGASGKVNLIVKAVDDLWTRDTAPVFVYDSNKNIGGVNFNFNGWGQVSTGASGWKKDTAKAANGIQDQPVANDQTVADFILTYTSTPKISTWLVMEGGGIEVDGIGTAICTESCILNANRNPGKTKADVEAELNRLLGVKKVIWLTGKKAQDITDGHIDFYARFVRPATVLCTIDTDPESPDYQTTLDNFNALSAATDVTGKPLTVIKLVNPDSTAVQTAVNSRNNSSLFNMDTFAAGYVGYYEANNAILMASFGDAAADLAAFNQIKTLFPERSVLQITTDGIANGGGTIHCATQQQLAKAV